jgi:hypothetical protein
LIFVRETSDDLTSLVKKIDREVETMTGKPDRPLGLYVIFDSNKEGLDQELRAMAARAGLKHVNLCIGVPPQAYEVAPRADLTVVVYNVARRGRQAVTANFALLRGELDEMKANDIVMAVSEVLPK